MSLLFGVLFVLLLAAGVVLSVWGLRGRRVGDEPRCRKCNYNLTGLTSEHCPECGTHATGENVVVGIPRWRWRVLAPGLLLLLVSIGGLGLGAYGRAKGVNWYAHLPTFVLIQLAEADQPPAIRELVRQNKAGTVEDEQLVGLIPLALAQQGRDPRPRSVWAWTELLATMHRAGRLSVPEQEQFYDQMVTLDVEFRPRVRQGEQLMFFFKHWTTGSPNLAGSFKVEDGVLRIGAWHQEDHHRCGGKFSHAGSGGGTGFAVETDRFEPGVYEVQLLATKAFTNPTFKRNIELTYELEILPPDAPDTVRLVNDPTLADAFKKAIRITTSAHSWGSPEPGVFYIEIAVDGPVPMDGAFQLLARIGEHEVDLGPE